MFHLGIPVRSFYTSRTKNKRKVLSNVISPPQPRVFVKEKKRSVESYTPRLQTEQTQISSLLLQKSTPKAQDEIKMSLSDFMEEDRLGYGFDYDDGIAPPPLNLTKLSKSHNCAYRTVGDIAIPSSIIGGLTLDEILYVSQTLKNHKYNKHFGDQCVLLHCKMKYKHLLRHIRKSFPTCRLLSRRNTLCYHKASKYINAFTKFCIKSCDQLIKRQCWDLIIEYTLLSWWLVDQLPDWEDKIHNSSKKLCFNKLSDSCLVALQSGHAVITKNTIKRMHHALTVDNSMRRCLDEIIKFDKYATT